MATKTVKTTAFKTGAEKKIVFLNTFKPTGVSQANVNTLAAFTFKKTIEEQKVTKIGDIKGLTTEDGLYKIIQAAFIAGIQEVIIKGVQIEEGTPNYKEFFDSVSNEYFGVVTDETEIEKLKLISKEVSSREKMFFATLAKETKITESTLKNLEEIAEDGTSITISLNEDTAHGSVAGYAIGKFPGSTLIANKLINGAADSGLNGAEQGFADKAKCNYMARMKGQLGLANGVTVTGDSIDYIHCLKALKFRLEEDMTLWLKATQKPDFYDLAPLKQTIAKRTAQFGTMGAIADERTSITFIPLNEIPENDILNGVLSGVKITVYYRFGIKQIAADLYFAV